MDALAERMEECTRPGSDSVNISLTVETRGGRPTCVEPSVWVAPLEKYQSLHWLSEDRESEAEVARCAAAVVARYLVLPESPEDEHCRWDSTLFF